MREPEQLVCTCCTCCALAVLTSQFFAGGLVLWSRAAHATPALCQEGRFADASGDADSRVSIHIQPGSSIVELECLIPVVVYDVPPLGEPRGNLRQIGVPGPFDVPFEAMSSGVKCLHSNASVIDHFNNIAGMQFYKSCEHDTWNCHLGECSSYQKALRVCLSKLDPDPYKCSYVPGSPTLGVANSAEQSSQILWTSLAVVLCVALCLLFAICGVPFLRYSEFPADRPYWILAMLLSGALVAGLQWNVMTGTMPRVRKAADLNAPCKNGDFEMCGKIIPEGAPWNRTLSPLVYFSIVFGPLICCLLCFGPFLFGIMARSRSGAATERSPLV